MNCEAILNILANGAEIFGKSVGISFLLGALSILFLKKWSIAGKLASAGLISLLLGFITPGFLIWIVASIHDANISMDSAEPWLLLGGILGLLLLIVAVLASWFMPTIVAFKRHRENRKLVLILNLVLGLIPLGWNVALFMSLMNDKQKPLSEKTQSAVAH